ncbi:DUF5681 domain-containing protein [Sphingomonas faeni]|uniref:DUF5681 domain-containing protein n=1 Tax=Sphingomonas faeni TaxID=185950 RepID=UPI00334911B6
MAKFEPGKSGNPAGRPAGARAKLGEAFVAELLADFLKYGRDAIERVRAEKPDQYLKVIASLLPKDINLSTAPSDEDLTDDELRQRIRELDASISKWMH